MPAVSKKQQKFMGIVHGLQKGTVKPSEVSKKAQKVAKDMKPKAATDFASTKHKGLPTKIKKESVDGAIDTLYMVRKPYTGCQLTSLVQPIDPLVGLGGSEVVPDHVHAVFPDKDQAMAIAETLYEEYCAKMEALEEKKGAVTGKISSAIDALEKKRKEHVDMAKEDPKNASKHKEKIAMIATKIDDLMTKLEKVEKSKKAKDEKEIVKESINEDDEPGSPERLMLTIKTPLMALINAAKKAVEQSGEEPYLSNKETDNAVDNLALLVNLCYMFLPEKSNNLRDVRSIKLALAKAANQKMGTPPAIPSKAPAVPNVTGKTNLGGKPPLPPLPTGKTAAKPPVPPVPPLPKK
jgi:hypothetical protein